MTTAGEVAPATSDAFASWVAPHLLSMRRLARRLAGPDSDDVVQEALVRAWRHRQRYDERRGSLSAWLLAIVANEARRRRPRVADVVEDVGVTDSYGDVDLERAVRRLSHRQRLAVELFYYLDLPVGEVARVMGVSDGTVKSTLADARRRLEQMLRDDA